MATVHRRELLAYLVGAGVAGTLLVAPYTLRVVADEIFLPGRGISLVPVVLLPIVWGLWNLLRVRRRLRVGAGTWGAMLGLLAAAGVNAYLRAAGAWFQAAALLVVFLPLLYWLLWRIVVGPLNRALGVDGDGG